MLSPSDPRPSNDVPLSQPTTGSSPDIAEAPVELSPIPSPPELIAFRARVEVCKREGIQASALGEFLQLSFSLRDRLTGEMGGNGGIKMLEVRAGWARHIHRTLTELERLIPSLYTNSPSIILDTIARDFTARLSSRRVQISHPHAQSTIQESLEQTRLMVIFSGKALKSSEHVQSALSGLQERDFSGSKQQASGKPAPLDASMRQSNFEVRQEAKRLAAEARKEALKNGGAAPVRGAKAAPPKDEEKSLLLSQTAADYVKLCRAAQPRDEQRSALTQHKATELRRRLASRLTKPPGPQLDDEVEALRIDLTNECARLARFWMEHEVFLASAEAASGLSLSRFSCNSEGARLRMHALEQKTDELKGALSLIDSTLIELGRAMKGAGSKAMGNISPHELKRLQALTEPPEEKPVYDLA